MRLTWAPTPASSCAKASGASATGVPISAPIWRACSCSYSGAVAVCPASWKVASWPNRVTPIDLASGAGSTIAPTPPNGVSSAWRTSVPPSLARLESAPTSSTDSLPRGPDALASASSSGAAVRTPGIPRTRASVLCGKPCGSRASSCSVASPAIPCVSSPTELCRLELDTCEANSSATPAAIPSTARHSCARRARRRTR